MFSLLLLFSYLMLLQQRYYVITYAMAKFKRPNEVTL